MSFFTFSSWSTSGTDHTFKTINRNETEDLPLLEVKNSQPSSTDSYLGHKAETHQVFEAINRNEIAALTTTKCSVDNKFLIVAFRDGMPGLEKGFTKSNSTLYTAMRACSDLLETVPNGLGTEKTYLAIVNFVKAHHQTMGDVFQRPATTGLLDVFKAGDDLLNGTARLFFKDEYQSFEETKRAFNLLRSNYWKASQVWNNFPIQRFCKSNACWQHVAFGNSLCEFHKK
jgi:hypothetical protein